MASFAENLSVFLFLDRKIHAGRPIPVSAGTTLDVVTWEGNGPMDATGIILVDRATMFREGLRQLFTVSVETHLLLDASSLGDVTDRFEGAADVLVGDILAEGPEGLDNASGLLRRGTVRAFVMLTSYADEARIAEAFRKGATGYVLKSASFDDLLGVIRIVAAGGSAAVLPGVVSRSARVGTQAQEGASKVTLASLTPRELQVARLLAAGESNRDIGGRLYLSEKAVRNYVSSIYQKTESRTRAEATLKLSKAGLP